MNDYKGEHKTIKRIDDIFKFNDWKNVKTVQKREKSPVFDISLKQYQLYLKFRKKNGGMFVFCLKREDKIEDIIICELRKTDIYFSVKHELYCKSQIFESINEYKTHHSGYNGFRITNDMKCKEIICNTIETICLLAEEKGFILKKNQPKEIQSKDLLEKQFQENIEHAQNDTYEIRQERLKNANKIPVKVQVVSYIFKRNPDVVAETLKQASGICQRCNNHAPFIRIKTETPYLEVHHIKPLAIGGEDSVKNTIALCPNCHRKMHYGMDKKINNIF